MDSTDSAILEYLKTHPGVLARDVADYLDKPVPYITNKMGDLARKTLIVRIPDNSHKNRGRTYRYYENECAFTQASKAFIGC